MDGTPLANKNAVVRSEKGHTWINEKWTWTINSDKTASYVLHIECSNCGKVVDHTNKSPVPIAQTDKTIKANCTTEGANYYTTEIVYEGATFVGEHTEKIVPTGHSFELEVEPKWKIEIDELKKQYHYHKCTNKDCPDEGKVDAAMCVATGENVAVCGKASTCDICKSTFGDILQHEWEKGECKLCKEKCDPHQWSNGVCELCTYAHDPHEWENGICKVCLFFSDEHEWENGVCKECKAQHEDHKWKNGQCEVCLFVHDHKIWVDGKCKDCMYAHEDHEWNNGQCTICRWVHDPHEWENGECVCGFKCVPHNLVEATCTICGLTDYKIFMSSKLVFEQESRESIVLETNGANARFEKVLIDGQAVNKQYLALSDGRIVIMPNYLNTLSVGEHNVVVQYNNGEISTTIVIQEASPVVKDFGKTLLYIAIGAFTVAVIAGSVIFYIYRIRDEYYDDDEEYEEEYEDDDDDDNPPPPPPKKTIAENVAARQAQQAQQAQQRAQIQQRPPMQQRPQTTQQPRNTQTIVLTTDEERAILDKVNREMKIDIEKILNEDN